MMSSFRFTSALLLTTLSLSLTPQSAEAGKYAFVGPMGEAYEVGLTEDSSQILIRECEKYSVVVEDKVCNKSNSKNDAMMRTELLEDIFREAWIYYYNEIDERENWENFKDVLDQDSFTAERFAALRFVFSTVARSRYQSIDSLITELSDEKLKIANYIDKYGHQNAIDETGEPLRTASLKLESVLLFSNFVEGIEEHLHSKTETVVIPYASEGQDLLDIYTSLFFRSLHYQHNKYGANPLDKTCGLYGSNPQDLLNDCQTQDESGSWTLLTSRPPVTYAAPIQSQTWIDSERRIWTLRTLGHYELVRVYNNQMSNKNYNDYVAEIESQLWNEMLFICERSLTDHEYPGTDMTPPKFDKLKDEADKIDLANKTLNSMPKELRGSFKDRPDEIIIFDGDEYGDAKSVAVSYGRGKLVWLNELFPKYSGSKYDRMSALVEKLRESSLYCRSSESL